MDPTANTSSNPQKSDENRSWLVAADPLPEPPAWAVAMPDAKAVRDLSSSVSTASPLLDSVQTAPVGRLPAPWHSPDDAFVESFGARRITPSTREMELLVGLLTRARELLATPDTSGHSPLVNRELNVRLTCGPIVHEPDQGKFCWVEALVPETHEYLIPDIATLLDENNEGDPCPIERFRDGAARLWVRLPDEPDSDDLIFVPWLSAQCRDEAISHFIGAVRTPDRDTPSLLYTAVLHEVYSQLLDKTLVPEDIPLSTLHVDLDLSIEQISHTTDGRVSFVIRFQPGYLLEDALAEAGVAGCRLIFGEASDLNFGLLHLELMSGADVE